MAKTLTEPTSTHQPPELGGFSFQGTEQSLDPANFHFFGVGETALEFSQLFLNMLEDLREQEEFGDVQKRNWSWQLRDFGGLELAKHMASQLPANVDAYQRLGYISGDSDYVSVGSGRYRCEFTEDKVQLVKLSEEGEVHFCQQSDLSSSEALIPRFEDWLGFVNDFKII